MDGIVCPLEWSEQRIRESQALFDRRGVGTYLVYEKDTNELVGFCGFWNSPSHGDPQLRLGAAFSKKLEAEIREAIEFHLEGMREDGYLFQLLRARLTTSKYRHNRPFHLTWACSFGRVRTVAHGLIVGDTGPRPSTP